MVMKSKKKKSVKKMNGVAIAMDVAPAVVATEVVVEEREWSVESELKEHFRELYQTEVMKVGNCPFKIKEESVEVVNGETKTAVMWRVCGEKIESIQQSLVHQSLHFLFDSPDPRTRRAAWNDIKELLFPTREKSIRAALSPDERRKMMLDPRMKERLLKH